MVKLPGWWYNNHIKSSLVCVTLAAGKAPGKPARCSGSRQGALAVGKVPGKPERHPGNRERCGRYSQGKPQGKPMDVAAIKKRGWCKL